MLELFNRFFGLGWKPISPPLQIAQYTATETGIEMPVSGGRSSVTSTTGAAGSLSIETDAGYDLNILKGLESLAIHDRYFSRAVSNIATLADTPEEIFFSKDVPEATVEKMRAHLENASKKWYFIGEGGGLNFALYRQLYIFGCLSAEMEILESMKGVRQVHLVSPAEIRFTSYDPIRGVWPAWQLPTKYYAAQKTMAGMIPLNYSQYVYEALARKSGSPYGVPPFLAAVQDIFLHNDMVGGFKQIMNMVGLLGFLSVNVKAPKQNQGETETAYQNRLKAYLENSIAPQIKKGLANGYAVGFQDTHDFSLQSAPTSAGQITPLVDFVKKLIFEGLKQDPNFHGENMTVTETFGRVLLSIMAKDIEIYQSHVKSFKERLYMTELRLAGFNPISLTVEFQKGVAGDKLKEEETESKRIDNVKKKYDMGIISQEQAAQELGYDAPDLPEPREVEGMETEPKEDETETQQNAAFAVFEALGGNVPPYRYDTPDCCGGGEHTHSFADFEDPKMERFIANYLGQSEKKYRAAIKAVSKDIERIIAGIRTPTQQNITAAVFAGLFTGWQREFIRPVKPVCEANQKVVYTHYRKDKKGFSLGKTGGNTLSFEDIEIPDAVWKIKDTKALNWLQNTDNFYLGKFITDPDTMERIRRFTAEQYLENGAEIGKESDALKAFMKAFEELMYLEKWKIRRIIETAVNNSRNFAQTYYIQQAGVEKYERVEVMDRLTCQHCAHVSGQEFSVETNAKTIEKITEGRPEDMEKISPFATTIPVSDFTKLSPEQIQSKGMGIGSLHPHCRGRWVAVI